MVTTKSASAADDPSLPSVHRRRSPPRIALGHRPPKALLAAAAVLLLSWAAVPTGSSERALAADQHPHLLVSMRQNNGQTYETVAVEANGSGEVGFFIGETTGTHYHAFSLGAHRLARLESLVTKAASLRRQYYLGEPSPSLPFVVDTEYIIRLRRRSFVTDDGHQPPRLHGHVLYLSGLIINTRNAPQPTNESRQMSRTSNNRP